MADAPTARRLTAVFCANDLLAFGVLQEMTRQVVFEPELVVRQSSHARPRPRRSVSPDPATPPTASSDPATPPTRRAPGGTGPVASPAVPDRAG